MNWYKHLLWLLVFLLFLAEGSLVPWILSGIVSDLRLSVAPQFVLIMIFYIAIYLNRPMAIAMALVFGLLHDFIYYGHMLGVYIFGMTLCVYLVGLILRDSHVTWYIGIGSVGLGLLLFHFLEYALYRLFQITDTNVWWHAVHGIGPSLLLNLTFAALIYYPVIKGFARIEKYVAPEEPEVPKAANT